MILVKWILDNWKLLIGVVLLFISFGTGWYINGNRLQIKIDDLNSAINAADAVAKTLTKQHEENLHAIQAKADSNSAAITAYYKRLLHAKDSSGTPTISPQVVNGSSGEQTPSGHDPEFERRCVKDANTVTLWQDWATRNHIPVEQIP